MVALEIMSAIPPTTDIAGGGRLGQDRGNVDLDQELRRCEAVDDNAGTCRRVRAEIFGDHSVYRLAIGPVGDIDR